MSAKIDLPVTAKASFESGSLKGLSAAQISSLIKDVVQEGVREGARIAITRYNAHVARKEGFLRTKLKSMIREQIKFPSNAKKFTVKFDMDKMDELDYAKYHIDGKPYHPGDVSPYRNPNKKFPGTRPIQSAELMSEIKSEAKKQVGIGLRAAGLKVTRSGF